MQLAFSRAKGDDPRASFSDGSVAPATTQPGLFSRAALAECVATPLTLRPLWQGRSAWANKWSGAGASTSLRLSPSDRRSMNALAALGTTKGQPIEGSLGWLSAVFWTDPFPQEQ
jgi:hypothetical protein